MEQIHIQLPSELLQLIRQEAPSDEALNQVVVEAVQMWLEKHHAEKRQKEQALQILRQAGVVMSSERQHTLAEALIAPLHLKKAPSREQVEAALSRLKVPLSEEIISMRGER